MKTRAKGAIGLAGFAVALSGLVAFMGNPFSGPFGGPSTPSSTVEVLTGTGVIDFPVVAEQETATGTVTVTGALTTDSVLCVPTDDSLATAPGVGIAFSQVTAANTVTLGILNTSAVGVDLASATWQCSILRP